MRHSTIKLKMDMYGHLASGATFGSGDANGENLAGGPPSEKTLSGKAVSLLGLEPKTHGLKVFSDPQDFTGKTTVSADGAATDAAVDPDLAAVIAAWRDLPDVIRRGILALASTVDA